MGDGLLGLARDGDREAFRALVDPHRAELQAHCYRMLGSLLDAEDAVQETLLKAWLALAGFEGRSSMRTWLYRIATNQCLSQLRAAKRRRPADEPAPAAPPTGEDTVRWLQPYPNELLADIPDDMPGPEGRYESREAISLAFVRALQLLPRHSGRPRHLVRHSRNLLLDKARRVHDSTLGRQWQDRRGEHHPAGRKDIHDSRPTGTLDRILGRAASGIDGGETSTTAAGSSTRSPQAAIGRAASVRVATSERLSIVDDRAT
jgi:RNA polymerase sigma factor (sigma-70 family)